MQWEGPETRPDVINVLHDDDGSNEPVQLPTPPPALSPSESEEDPDSEDEYVVETETVKGKRPSRVCTLLFPCDDCLLMHGTCSVGRATQFMQRIQITLTMIQVLASLALRSQRRQLPPPAIVSANWASRIKRGNPNAKSPQMPLSQ